MIEFDGVGKRYASGQEALSDISFALDKGEMTFLTGHSGAGKSTLLKLIMLLERPTRGRILIDGIDIGRLRRRAIPALRRQMGVVYQDHQLLMDRTVFDNVALPLLVAGHRQVDIARRVRGALDKVGLLQKEKRSPQMLSGGEQQRVGIARAVVNKPPFLLADEPTAGLDPAHQIACMETFSGIAKDGRAVVASLHDLGLAARHCTRLVVIHTGRIVANGPPRHVLTEALLSEVFSIRCYISDAAEGLVVQPLGQITQGSA